MTTKRPGGNIFSVATWVVNKILKKFIRWLTPLNKDDNIQYAATRKCVALPKNNHRKFKLMVDIKLKRWYIIGVASYETILS